MLSAHRVGETCTPGRYELMNIKMKLVVLFKRSEVLMKGQLVQIGAMSEKRNRLADFA
jgi:hypothetical protein